MDPRIDIQEELAKVNTVHRNLNTGIHFYIRSISIRNNSSFYNSISSGIGFALLWRQMSNDKAINMHIIRDNDQDYDGLAVVPHSVVPDNYHFKFMVRTNIDEIDHLGTVMAHELGHCLNLRHTHHYGRWRPSHAEDNASSDDCFQESVSRTRKNTWSEGCYFTFGKVKCEINGDFLSDTPADPNMSERGTVLNDHGVWVWIPPFGNPIFDNWGDVWNPDVFNIMAYGNRDCRNSFSPLQIAAMRYTLINDFFPTRPMVKVSGPNYVGTSDTRFYGFDFSEGAESWRVSSNLIIVSQGRDYIDVKAAPRATGPGWIDLDVSSDAGDFSIRKNVEVGPTIVPDAPEIQFLHAKVYQNTSYSASAWASNATGYEWVIDGGFIDSGQGTATVYFTTGTGSTLTIKVRAMNGDAHSPWTSEQHTLHSTGGYVVPLASPNPASHNVNVQIPESYWNLSNHKRYEYLLYNQMQSPVVSGTANGRNFSINISSIPNGYYILNLNHKEWNIQVPVMISK